MHVGFVKQPTVPDLIQTKSGPHWRTTGTAAAGCYRPDAFLFLNKDHQSTEQIFNIHSQQHITQSQSQDFLQKAKTCLLPNFKGFDNNNNTVKRYVVRSRRQCS